jgi:D-glucosaminate-6-phosphate ammonia-lyase
MAAALQHLDLDIFWDMWEPPPSFIDKTRLKGLPQHGIGRSCKAGKEEIAGLLTALRLFLAEGDAVRHARWLSDCETIAAALLQHDVEITGRNDTGTVPQLVMTLDAGRSANGVMAALLKGEPAIAVDPSMRDLNKILINPMRLAPGQAEQVGTAISRLLA